MDSKMMFPLSSEFKQAMGEYASAHNISIAELIRTSVAKEIGFELEPTQKRQKYNSPEERKEAQKARAREERALARRLVSEYRETHK